MNYFLKEFKNNDQVTVNDTTVYLRLWSLENHKPLPKLIEDALSSGLTNFTLIISNPEEFEVGSNFEKKFNKDLKTKIKKQNIKIYFIFGSQDLNFYKQESFLYHDPDCNMFVYLWPTYWINNTIKYTDYKRMNLDKTNIKYCYCTLNYVGKYHRCLLMDLLSKNNLIQHGAISWHDFCVDSTYKWRWLNSKPDKMILSDGKEFFEDNYNQQHNPPIEFFQSFMSIISETTDKTIFLTEKTCMALLLKQPFLIQGSVGFHEYLKSLGFELYTEIFDYSFDIESDIEKRTDMIIDNIKSIINSDLNQLYDLIKPKLEYNQQVFFKISKDRSKFPQIVIEDQFLKDLYNFDI